MTTGFQNFAASLAISAAFILPGLGVADAVAQDEPNISRGELEDIVNDARRTIRDMDDEIGSFRRNLEDAVGIMVFPRIIKAGFILAVEGGTGVLLSRYEDLRDPPELPANFPFEWSAPAFYALAAGSVGFQIGASGSQVAFLFMTERAFERALDGDFEIGAEVNITVVNEDERDSTFEDADVLSYAIANGLFAGIALEGAAVNEIRSAHDTFYGRRYFAEEVVSDPTIDNPEVDRLRELLTELGERD
jgi:lipid-binding SYLF domain-containing protein